MNWTRTAVPVDRFGKLVAAIVVGLGLGTLLSPEPVAVPLLGPVSGLAVGAVALVGGTAVYVGIDRSSTDCGCAGDCGCS